MNRKFIITCCVVGLAVVVVLIVVTAKNSNTVVSGTDQTQSTQQTSNIPVIQPLQTQSTKLADIPTDYFNALKITAQLLAFAFSSDGTKVAYVVKRDSKSSVFINGNEGPWYDSIAAPILSGSIITITQGGDHVFYIGHRDSKDFIVEDGTEVASYPSISQLLVGKTGTFATMNTDADGNTVVTFNGKAGPKYNAVLYLTMNPDESGVAYYGCDKTDDGCYFVNQDSSGTAKTDFVWSDPSNSLFGDGAGFIGHGQILFTTDGKLLAYIKRSIPYGDQVVVNGETVSSQDDWVDKINISNLVFTPDNQSLAYIEEDCSMSVACDLYKNEGKMYVVYNSTKGNPYDEIQDLTFSPTGQLIYWARKGNDWYIVLDGKESYQFSTPSRPGGEFAFATDGSWAYTIFDGTNKTKVEYNTGKETKYYAAVVGLRYTPNNKLIFMGATGTSNANAKMMLVVDGKEHQSYDQIWPFLDINGSYTSPIYKYTPDGNNVVYGAQKGSELWWVVDPIN